MYNVINWQKIITIQILRNISNNNNKNNINYNIYLFNVASLQIATIITFNNSTVLPNVDYGAAVKLEITSIGEVT